MDSSDRMKNKKQIQKELKSNEAILQCAQEFGLVGDPTRMKICWLLCKHPQLTVSEIAEILSMSISRVSHSLRKLRDCNLVETKRQKKNVLYKLTDCSFNVSLKKILNTI